MGQAPSYLMRALCWVRWPAGKSLSTVGVTETAPSPAAGIPLGVGQEACGDPQETPATFQRSQPPLQLRFHGCPNPQLGNQAGGPLSTPSQHPGSPPGALQVPALAWPGATRLPQGLGTAPALAAHSPSPPSHPAVVPPAHPLRDPSPSPQPPQPPALVLPWDPPSPAPPLPFAPI